MYIRFAFFAFALGLFLLSACKKFTDLPKYNITSQVLRLSKSWITSPTINNQSAAVDNTRVILTFQTNGNYSWITRKTIKGVESSRLHEGKWKFIDQNSKIVLENTSANIPKRDTFIVEILRTEKLYLLPLSNPSFKATSLSFEAE